MYEIESRQLDKTYSEKKSSDVSRYFKNKNRKRRKNGNKGN